jgi:toxin ParE1/3/4
MCGSSGRGTQSATRTQSKSISRRIARRQQSKYATRLSCVRGTRELVIAGLPWIVVYRVTGGTIEVVRVLHGAQQWP